MNRSAGRARRKGPLQALLGVSMGAQPEGRVVGFLDIGTNSIRLLLVRIGPAQAYSVLTVRKEVVRLGEGEFGSGRLQPDAMNRAVLVSRKFAEMARSRGAEEIVAVATSATREARNQREFLEKLRAEAGIDVRVVSGREEARLIYLGVVSGLNLAGRKAVFIDIGGGSTEIIVGDEQRYQYLDTLRLGAIRLTLLLLRGKEGPVSSKEYGKVQSYVRDAAIRTIQSLERQSFEIAVGSSGTIENLADITYRLIHERPREPDDVLTLEDLQSVVVHLRSIPLEERRAVPGINPERADIIIGGAAILQTLMQELELNEMRISSRGLRDGLLLDYLARHERDGSGKASFREESVLRLGRATSFDETHARHVADLAQLLFDSASEEGLHPFGEHERELLEYAALLHDIGVSLSYSNHQAHSHYFIRNADLLGFDQQEIAIIAATARYHRKAYPKKKHPEFRSLDKSSQEIVRVLCLLLSLAESLDHSHMGLVTGARFHKLKRKDVELQIETRSDSPLELWAVSYHAESFRRAFGHRLKALTVVGEPLGTKLTP